MSTKEDRDTTSVTSAEGDKNEKVDRKGNTQRLKDELNEKVKSCTMFQEKLRALELTLTTLRADKTSELHQQRHYFREVEKERAKIAKLRKSLANKAQDHVQLLKTMHAYDTKIKSLALREDALNRSIAHSQEITKSSKERSKEIQRELMSAKLDMEGLVRELGTAKSDMVEYRERLQRKEFEIMRESHTSRVLVQNVKRSIAERNEIVSTLAAEKAFVDQEVVRLSQRLDTCREDARRVRDALNEEIKVEEERVTNLRDANAKLESIVANMRESLQATKDKEKVLGNLVEAAKQSLLSTRKSAREKRSSVHLMQGRVKDLDTKSEELTRQLADVDAHQILVNEKLQNVKVVRDGTVLALKKAQTRLEKVMDELKNEIVMDSTHGKELEKAKEVARTSEIELGSMTSEEEASKTAVNAVNTKVELLRRDIEAVNQSCERRRETMQAQLKEGEMLAKRLQSKEQEHAYKSEQFQRKHLELEDQLNEKNVDIDRLKQAIATMDVKLADIKVLMQHKDSELQADRKHLERQIENFQKKTSSLSGELNDNEDRGYEAGLTLRGLEGKVATIEARYSAKKKEIQPLTSDFDNSVVQIQDKLSTLQRRTYDMEDELTRTRTETRALQHNLDDEMTQAANLSSKLRSTQLKLATASDRFRIQSRIQSDCEESLRSLKKSLKLAEENLETKSAECTTLMTEMKSMNDTSDFQKSQIVEERAGQVKMHELLSKERSLVLDVDRIIKIKQGKFESDSNAVSDRLTTYQKMLVERCEAAKRVSNLIRGETETQKLVNAQLQTLMDDMETERTVFDEQFNDQTSERDEKRTQISDQEVSIMESEAEVHRAAEALSDRRIILDGALNQVEVWKDELDLSEREIRQLRLSIETRGATEKELFASLEIKDQTIKLLEAQLEDAEGVDRSMRAQIDSLRREKRLKEEKLARFRANEDELLDKMEKVKLNFSSVADHGTDVLTQTSQLNLRREGHAHTLLAMSDEKLSSQ